MKKLLALVLALVMTMSLVTISNAAFKDADKITADHEEAVEVMSAIGVLVGDEKQNFNAKDNLTRAQAAKIISYLLLGNKTAEALVGSNKFSDVAATNWAAGFIDYCASESIVSGVGDGKFDPNGQLTGYQFAKMLLGALGYDATIQGFTGTDWQINVSKIANLVGLFEGLNIKGTDVLNREQAAQMAFNTLKSPLVEYNNKGGNVTINGAVIGISASDYEYVTTTIAKEQTISKQYLSNTNKGIYTVEFAERYYPDLTLTADEDDFGRPARTWAYNKETVGTFVNYDQLVAEYTVKVTGKTMYTDIGYKNINDYATYAFENGKTVKNFDADKVLTKNNDKAVLTSGKGVLTQVFVNDTDETITIVVIHTYLAKATADYNAKKEYLTVEVYGNNEDSKILLEDAANIVDVKDGDYLLVNIADGEIVAVSEPTVVTDTKITKYSVDNSLPSALTAGGTAYDSAKDLNMAPDKLKEYDKDALVDYTYNLYIDQYGYVIGVKQYSGEAKYLFLVGYDKTTSYLTKKTADAAVILADGTMQTVKIDLTKSEENLLVKDKNGKLTNTRIDQNYYPELSTKGNARYNAWFTYSVDKNDVYTLDVADHYVNVKATSTFDSINVENVRLTDAKKRAYGNDDSIYITVETKANATDDGIAINKVKNVYTGVQNINLKVETTAATDNKSNKIENSVFAVYDDDGYIIAAVVRGTEGTASENYAYAVKGAQNEYLLGDDDYYYWDFKAIQDGEYKTLTVKTEYKSTINTIKSLLTSNKVAGDPALLKLTLDKDGYVTEVEVVTDDAKKIDSVYGNFEFGKSYDIDPKNYDVYMVTSKDVALKAVGRTLYSSDAKDIGLTLASGAPVVVLQPDSDGDLSIEEYNNIAQALDALENSDKFEGVIAAALNDKGTAEFIVLSSATKLTDNSKDDGKNKSGLTLKSMSYDRIDEKFAVSFTTKGEIADGTEYTITITNKDGGKLLTQDGKIATKVGAGETGTVTADYTAVSGTGTYIVTVEIGKLSASETLIVA